MLLSSGSLLESSLKYLNLVMDAAESHFNRISDSRTLIALTVFQGIQNAEYIRSIHLYNQGGAALIVQHEFLFSPGEISRISQPIPCAYSFRNFPSSGLKHFMDTLQKMHRNDCWKCVLEFCIESPCDATIIPLLSVSRNPALETIPCLAHDLRLVERAIENNTIFSKSDSLPGSPCSFVYEINDGCNDTDVTDVPKPLSKIANWTLPALCASPPRSTQPQIHDIQEVKCQDNSSQTVQLDIWHEWGSDLELASPRMSETFHPSTWRNSIAESSLPVTGNWSASSTNSSLFNSSNVDPSSWAASSIELDSQMMRDFVLEDTPILVNSLLPTLRPKRSGDVPVPGTSIGLQTLVTVQQADFKCLPLESPFRHNLVVNADPGWNSFEGSTSFIEGTKSACCDESIVPKLESDKPGQYLRLFCLPSESGTFNVKVGMKDTFQECASVTSNVVFHNGRGRWNRRNTNGRYSNGQSHHRSSSARMTAEITMTKLSRYFDLPIAKAAEELKVGLTVLKKRCREFGIPRWPHRKMKSLDSLIQNIQDLAELQGNRPPARVLHTVRDLEEQKRRMKEMPAIELAEKTKRLRQACFKDSYKKRLQQGQSLIQEPHKVSASSDICPSSQACQ